MDKVQGMMESVFPSFMMILQIFIISTERIFNVIYIAIKTIFKYKKDQSIKDLSFSRYNDTINETIKENNFENINSFNVWYGTIICFYIVWDILTILIVPMFLKLMMLLCVSTLISFVYEKLYLPLCEKMKIE